MKKELVTIEFRYKDVPPNEDFSGHKDKTITIGIFETLDEAIKAGNEAIAVLAKSFEVRPDDKFKKVHLFGSPKRLVTNTCYSKQVAQFFAKITQLDFIDLPEMIKETYAGNARYREYKASQNSD